MNSNVSMSRWLLVGILSFSALLGCESDEEKAKDQANKANAYINEQNTLRKDLLSDYSILVPKTEILTEGELYINLSAGQYVNYFPTCIQDGTRTDIKNKLARIVVLSEEIQKIMANEDVRYSGPSSDFEHVKQNARLMLGELDKNPDCNATSVSAPTPQDEQPPAPSTEDGGDMTPQEQVNQWVNEVQEARDLLEADYGIEIPVDEQWSNTEVLNGDYLPQCWETPTQMGTVITSLNTIYVNVSLIRAKVATTDAEYGGDEADLTNLDSNVANLMQKANMTEPCN